jgi:hypothetical protein
MFMYLVLRIPRPPNSLAYTPLPGPSYGICFYCPHIPRKIGTRRVYALMGSLVKQVNTHRKHRKTRQIGVGEFQPPRRMGTSHAMGQPYGPLFRGGGPNQKPWAVYHLPEEWEDRDTSWGTCQTYSWAYSLSFASSPRWPLSQSLHFCQRLSSIPAYLKQRRRKFRFVIPRSVGSNRIIVSSSYVDESPPPGMRCTPPPECGLTPNSV